jgi:nucleotide-binding universal stress UspA family protein
MPNVIAVGVDGSGPSVVALRWALRLAEVHGAELTAVIARPPTSDPSRESPAELAARTAEIEQHLAQVSRTIAETAQGAPVTVRSLEGNPTEVLLGVSDRVDLLVVGGHGYKGWRRHFTTSVAGQLAIRTRAAVCVVREIREPAAGRVLVGHESETGSAAALFAVRQAAQTGARVLIVTTWQYPRDTRATSPEAATILEEGAAAALDELACALRAEFPAVPIDTVVQLGTPVEVLAELAEDADMVVIGTPEHRRSFGGGLFSGGLATLVVGSVAIGLLRRVRTPVVIVPTEE